MRSVPPRLAGAIQEFEDINIPKMDWSVQWMVCVLLRVPDWPFFDETYSETERLQCHSSRLTLGAYWLTDRAGIVVAEGVVQRVVAGKKPSGTPVVWVSAPKIMATVVRGFALRKEAGVHG